MRYFLLVLFILFGTADARVTPQHCPTWVEYVRILSQMTPKQRMSVPGHLRDFYEAGRITRSQFLVRMRAWAFVQRTPRDALEKAPDFCPEIEGHNRDSKEWSA